MRIDPISRRLLQNAGALPVAMGKGPVVLMYHALHRGAGDGWKWSLSVSKFREHLELLRENGWTTLRVRDLAPGGGFPAKTALITFDDGYMDNYELGVPLLDQFGMTATWFIVTDCVGKHATWDRERANKRRVMGENQLVEMDRCGMEIGSHTRTHRDLMAIPDHVRAEELVGSKMFLQDLLGKDVVSFAYPFGSHDDHVVSSVASAGYKIACTSNAGWLGSDPDPLRVRRVAVYAGDSASVLARKLAFAYTDVGWIRTIRYLLRRCLDRVGFPGRSGRQGMER